MGRMIALPVAKNPPLFSSLTDAPLSEAPSTNRIDIMSAFLKNVVERGYTFEAIWEVFLKEAPLHHSLMTILLSLTLNEFDTFIDDAQLIFPEDVLLIEKMRCSFFLYQLAETCQDVAYVPFSGNTTAHETQAPFIQKLTEDVSARYFPTYLLMEEAL